MITVRRAADRGRTQLDWLDSRHTFSFGQYDDPAHRGFRSLRVINEDRVSPGAGFPPHSHRDMEIISYVLTGTLEHRDSQGNGSEIRPGEVQRMSAGTGIQHSEFNASKTEPVHFLQIWIVPRIFGITPGYEQQALPPAEGGQLQFIAAPEGMHHALTLHRDASLYVATLASADDRVTYALQPNRHVWLQVVRGSVSASGEVLQAGDGAALSNVESVTLTGSPQGGEVLLFDLV